MKRFLLAILILLAFGKALDAQLNLQWENLGPDNLGGPVRSLILDNRDATRQTLYAGVMGGGVWKSTNGAASWSFLGCTANYAVSCMAQASNGTIYVGTGDGFNSSINFNNDYGRSGNGIYKLDASDNFISLLSTVPADTFQTYSGFYSPWLAVNRIAINPTNSSQLIAANFNGLFKSNDGGASWSSVAITGLYAVAAYDVKWGPDGSKIFAELGNLNGGSELVQSLDGGITWGIINSTVNHGFPSGANGRIEIAIAPSNSNFVYISVATPSGTALKGIYRSVNAGNTWDTVALGTLAFDPFKMQGWFDNAIIVSPEDSNKIFGGGSSMYSYSPQTGLHQLTDFVFPNADTGLYIDQFMYVINDLNPNELYVATDRGVFKSTQANANFTSAQFTASNNGLKARDMNSVAVGRNGQVIGGSQFDDGLLIGNTCNQHFRNLNAAWGLCDISHLDTNYAFIEGIDGSIYESNNLLATYSSALDSSIDPLNTGRASRCGEPGDFAYASLLLHETRRAFLTTDSVTFLANTPYSSGAIVIGKSTTGNVSFPYILNASLQVGDSIRIPDPVKSNLFILSPCGIWMKKHAIDQMNTPDWFHISRFGNLTCISVTANGNKVYAGYQNGTVLSISGLNLGHYNNYNMVDSFSFSIDTFMTTTRGVQSIYVDPNNDNHIVLTISTYVGDTVPNAYKSTNGGLTWNRLQIGPVGTTALSCIIDAANASNYIVGTNQGIWTSNDAGVTWHQDDANMCNISVSRVRQIPLYNDSCYVIYAATNSKGLWRSVTLTAAGCNTTLAACDSTLSILSPTYKTNEFAIYPNPATAYTTVEFTITEPQQVTIQLHDITGRLVQTWLQFLSANNQKVELNTSSLHAGTYLVSVSTGQMQQTRLLVITE